jgi:hypothetical protein
VAVHAAIAVVLMSLVPAVPRILRAPADAGDSAPVVVFIAPRDALFAQPAERDRPSAPKAPADDLGIHVEEGASTVTIGDFRIDFGKVAEHAGSLFPFLTGNLSLERIAASARPSRSTRLMNPFGGTARADAEVPGLTMSPSAMQALLDKTWSRRERWHAFQPLVPLLDGYHPDDGDLAALLRGYVVQNGLQPYADPRIRDPRLWTELALAADHTRFIDLIGRYVGDHPSTKTATELLFLLDAMVQGSYDALITLLDVVPDADLEWTRASNADAVRAIVTIQKHYRAELERRGLTSRDAIRLYFDEARLSILTNIIATTPGGYRASDAQVLVGSIDWKQGRTDDAVDVWNRMTIDRDGVHARMANEILDAIRGRDVRQLDIRSVNRALEGDRSRWVSTSYERLRQFGYHFNTY